MQGLIQHKKEGYNLVINADSLEVYPGKKGVMVSLFNVDDSLNDAEVIKRISLDKIIETFGADNILDYIGTKAINEFLK
jgi:hypothetical protein